MNQRPIEDPQRAEPLLVPAPRSLERHAGTTPAADPAHAAADLPAGAYRLYIDGRIRIESSSPSGRAAGEATLRQLAHQYGSLLPNLTIDDAPAVSRRGFMLDVSRDRIPTQQLLLALPSQLAALKLDHLQLYTEHTYAFPGHETVWSGWDPITPEQFGQLQAACADASLELAANQNCFGHLAEWFRTSGYGHLAEIQPEHNPWSFFGTERHGGFSLCPTDPEALELAQSWIDHLCRIASSPLINIGCDETGDVGQGRSRELVERAGLPRAWLGFVEHLCARCEEHGATPMLWADIPQSEPEILAALPASAVPIVWDYEPPQRNSDPFDRHAQVLAAAGRRFWLSPGTSCWRSFTGRTSERRANVNAAARAARARGSEGVLVTAWGDLGHRQQWPVTLLALAESAAAMWSGSETGQLSEAISLQVFNDRSGRVASWLAELGDSDAPLRAVAGYQPDAPLLNATALFEEISPARPGRGTPGLLALWHDTRDRLAELARSKPAPADPQLDRELQITLDRAQLAADWAIHRRTSPGTSAPELAERQRAITELHRELWLATSRPGGLESSCAHDLRAADRMDAGETG